MNQATLNMTCNACNSSLTVKYSMVQDPLTNDLFSVFQCTKCGLGHTVPQPGNLAPYYAACYYGNRHGFTSRLCSHRRLGYVTVATGSGVGKTLLDIGCGDGSFLLAARRVGWDIMGTELNPLSARNSGIDVREDISELSCQGEALFDCITMWHTLEHMRDIKSTLRDVVKLLAPRGRLIIAVPNLGGLQARLFGPKWLHLDVPRHLYHFDEGALHYCLVSAGLSIEQQWHQELEYDLLGWSQSALNFLMPYPNVFFNTLTGKKSGCNKMVTASAFILGVLLTMVSVPAVFWGTLIGRGGTLIAVACRK